MSEHIILVVDDDSGNTLLICRILRSCGFNNILTADDGRTGLDAFNRDKIDLVITDLRMRYMDGDVMMQEIRKTGSKVKIILTTASPEQVYSANNALKDGADAFIHKLDLVNSLGDAIGRLLAL